MIGLENKDSAFFELESPDVATPANLLTSSLRSLNIEESLGALSSGSLVFNDPKNQISKILRTGVRLKLAFGYKRGASLPGGLPGSQADFDRLSGGVVRRGYLGYVYNPAWDMGETITYSCNFATYGLRGEQESRLFKQGTKDSVINQALDSLGVSKVDRYVNFTLGADRITSDKYVRQDGTTFEFLNQKAIEWKAVFFVSYGNRGQPVAIFVDRNRVNKTPLPGWIMGTSLGSNKLGYRGKISNVIRCKANSNEAENGVGAHIRVEIRDGQIEFRQFVATEEKIITWRLDREMLKQEYDGGDLQEQFQITKELLSAKNFDEVKRFFNQVEDTTAPDGYGYRMSCDVLGNPFLMPGSKIELVNGFPGQLGGRGAEWYIQRVNHRIDASGYVTTVEIEDVFNSSPVGLPVF
jgi:hypothetical protein